MERTKGEYNKAIQFYQNIINAFNADLAYYELLVTKLKPRSILELGCGSGRLFPCYLDKVEEVVGIDISEEMIKKASEIGNDSKTKIRALLGEITNFSLEEKFDLVVISNSLLKHIKEGKDRQQILKNARNHLTESGVISIDHASFLYYEPRNTEWVRAEQSVIAKWIPNKNNLLNGYEWKKTISGMDDIVDWRYIDQGDVKFFVSFSTYIYKIEDLISDLEAVGLKYRKIYSDYIDDKKEVGTKGNRFIAILSPLSNTLNQAQNKLND